ncbi:MAG: glycosyl hydrolase, partial [Isosphaeraceae bacterium]
MVTTWIDTAAKGRQGGPVRAGMWSSVVLGTHPIADDQEVWLELAVDDQSLGTLPAYWNENKGSNSHWHVPIPPQAVGARLHYRAGARQEGSEPVFSAYQDTMVRPNLPDWTENDELVTSGPEGLVGNRKMTVKIDGRGTTYDVYFPTVGLHSDVRPAQGDLSRSRSHFRAIVGGLAVGRRLDWFSERLTWEAFQHYLGATNLLVTELSWRNGPIRVLLTDLVVTGDCLPRTAGATESPGQYVKRFRVKNEGDVPLRTLFGVYIHAEVNGGIGEMVLSWQDGDRTLLATNRGHGHANRKLARDATVEFAVAFDDGGEVYCEPTGPNAAILLRWLDLPARGSVTIDLLVSGAFTGWRGDPGTFEHWIRPALRWFRSTDLDQVEQASALQWDAYVEPIPNVFFPKPSYGVTLRRSALAMALHSDATWGGIASSFDRGLNAYCWPREAVVIGGTCDRIGHPEIGRQVYQWLGKVRGRTRPYSYWFQKYTIDGFPEWETPAADQSALIPWGLERHYLRTGDRDLIAASWPMIEQAAAVSRGESRHPGLRWIDSLHLVSSAGLWGYGFGAFLFTNCCVVAGLRSASRLAELLGRGSQAEEWSLAAERIWERGVLVENTPGHPDQPGLVDAETGRFLDARRLSTLRGMWTDVPENQIDPSVSLDISMLCMVIPLGLLPASDPRVARSVEMILRGSAVDGDPNALSRWSHEPGRPERGHAPTESHFQDCSSLATLWMARYLFQLGRESGQARHWARALAMLDGVLGRLLPLGLAMRTVPRLSDFSSRLASAISSGAWSLHASLIETLMDVAGLNYQAVGASLQLDPILPSAWP